MQHFTSNQQTESDLVVDAIYLGGRHGNAGDDPLPRLLGVSNQGGFRYLGSVKSPKLIVLTSSFNDPDWPDSLDRETGVLTYYGDNKRPGRLLHETPRNGNRLLRHIFNATHSHPPLRHEVPPILVFGSAGTWRDMRFLGLAVPGSQDMSPLEDLVAIWKISGQERFQNYRATLTVLDIPIISWAWLVDIKANRPLSSNCPQVFAKWMKDGAITPLVAERSTEFRTRAQQMPVNDKGLRLLKLLHGHFSTDPIAFERCAASILHMMDTNFGSIELTRATRDGGRDAIGKYRIGPGPSAISVEFAMEAKCYGIQNSVGVREVSRLISRLRHRQFGILITTSYVNTQAYREIKEDGHPVIIVSARDIVELFAAVGINRVTDLRLWLKSNFPSL